MIEEFDGVRSWASILDDVTREQAIRTAQLPIISGPVALMPDAHLGAGATIGSVIVTENAIIPMAVGVDIGCGMAARKLDLRMVALPDLAARGWVIACASDVPAGLGRWHARASERARDWLEDHPAPSRLDAKDRQRAALQLGTLGSGNHFVELSVDESGYVWLLLHSGSRGAGNRLAMLHGRVAAGLHQMDAGDRDLAWLDRGTPEFDEYVEDLLWSQAYALQNRAMLLSNAHDALNTVVGRDLPTVDEVNCHHNYAIQEQVEEIGKALYVTRKGAIRAGIGDRGLIPGAMGQASFVVRGLGNPKSYESCSHGAGRVMSRTRARKEIPVTSFAEVMAGVAWQERDADSLLDEHPASYKDVETVMRDQADLVEVECRLTAIANYKGVETRTRRGRISH